MFEVLHTFHRGGGEREPCHGIVILCGFIRCTLCTSCEKSVCDTNVHNGQGGIVYQLNVLCMGYIYIFVIHGVYYVPTTFLIHPPCFARDTTSGFAFMIVFFRSVHSMYYI